MFQYERTWVKKESLHYDIQLQLKYYREKTSSDDKANNDLVQRVTQAEAKRKGTWTTEYQWMDRRRD